MTRPRYALGAAACFLLISCSRTQPTVSSAKPGARTAQALVASVASSTVEAIERLIEQFHAQSGVEVKVNAGPTSGLATQILNGAPADVFLSASREWADKVDDAGHAAEHVDLLTNRLVVIVPKGNPAGVAKPEDLSSSSVKKLALAGENVPAGTYADQALTKLGMLQPLTEAGKIVRGQDVRAALGFVERGEAEAGIVYASDVHAAPGVETACEIDPALHEKIVYVLVLLKHETQDDAQNAAARKFYDFLQTSDAKHVFSDLGFVPLGSDGVK